MRYDVAIIGGGIVGAATLYKLQLKNPDLKIVLIEKEKMLADHQTGHNSGVIHSGLYYTPGSLKAKNCVSGRHELVAFAKEHNIAHDICGKVVVATKESEFANMDKIFNNGIANNIEGIEEINADQIREIEPHVKGIKGIWVPCTGIIDFRGATSKMVEIALARQKESKLLLETEVLGIEKHSDYSTIVTNKEKVEAKYLVFCAGYRLIDLLKRMVLI